MNILQQYKKARAESGYREIIDVTASVEVGETFEFGGYSWQQVGEVVNLVRGKTVYGSAKIISIDAGGFKTAKRTS